MVAIGLYQAVTALFNARKNRILLIAQSSMSEHQFKAFRTLVLDELGERGLEKELRRLFMEKQQGLDGNGRE